MKRVIVIVAVTTVSLTLKAQKGSWYVGGNVGFSSTQDKFKTGNTETDDGKTTAWSFSPEAGTFLTDRVQLGVALTLAGSKFDAQESPINTVITSSNYGGTLYGRYFCGKDAFKPFVGLNVTVLPGSRETKVGNTSTESDLMNFGANLNAGFGYAIAKRWTAVGSFGLMGYEYSSSESGGTKETRSIFGLDANTLGNRFTIGFYYTL